MNNGRGGFHQNNRFGNANAVQVEIKGWNGASPAECVGFIQKKCKVKVSNYSVNNANGAMLGFVKNTDDANTLVTWSGVKFAGNALLMKVVGGTNGKQGNQTGSNVNAIEALTMFLKSRYNPQNRLLNLSSVQQDPTLTAQGFFGTISTSSKFFPALMKVASDLRLDVTSADLSSNSLSDLTTVSTLAQTFPALQNLSLHNNKLTRVKTFDVWKKKLNLLRELVITGNPLVNINDQNEAHRIKVELLKVFPRLVVLNGEVVRNEQVLSANLTFPFKDPISMFFEDNDVRGISTNFITNYYNLWDTTRANLMVLYQSESQFSLLVDSSLPNSVDGNSITDFGYYLPLSRNLVRVSSTKARMTKVAKGQEQIFKIFSQLPASKHDLILKPDNFCMESYRLASLGAICITLHGSFQETGAPANTDHVNQQQGSNRNRYAHQKKQQKIALGPKSFDRTFVIIPGPNGSMIVASDLLCIRPEAPADAFKPDVTLVAPTPTPSPSPAPMNPVINPGMNPGNNPGIPVMNQGNPGINTGNPAMNPVAGFGAPSAADLPAEIKANLNNIQQDVLVKVLVETKLTIQYGLMLCQQSNWDYQSCLINFKNSALSLPRDAFAS